MNIMQSKKSKSIFALVCIMIIIAYISIVFLPHAHDCVSSDCAACALLEGSRYNAIFLVVAIATHQLSNITLAISSAFKPIASANSRTPIALKVKLSD